RGKPHRTGNKSTQPRGPAGPDLKDSPPQTVELPVLQLADHPPDSTAPHQKPLPVGSPASPAQIPTANPSDSSHNGQRSQRLSEAVHWAGEPAHVHDLSTRLYPPRWQGVDRRE